MADLHKLGLTPEQLLNQPSIDDKQMPTNGEKDQKQVYLLHFLDKNGKPFMQTIAEDETELKDKMDNIFMHKDTIAMLIRKIHRVPS